MIDIFSRGAAIRIGVSPTSLDALGNRPAFRVLETA
jgi:hypothetical protein